MLPITSLHTIDTTNFDSDPGTAGLLPDGNSEPTASFSELFGFREPVASPDSRSQDADAGNELPVAGKELPESLPLTVSLALPPDLVGSLQDAEANLDTDSLLAALRGYPAAATPVRGEAPAVTFRGVGIVARQVVDPTPLAPAMPAEAVSEELQTLQDSTLLAPRTTAERAMVADPVRQGVVRSLETMPAESQTPRPASDLSLSARAEVSSQPGQSTAMLTSTDDALQRAVPASSASAAALAPIAPEMARPGTGQLAPVTAEAGSIDLTTGSTRAETQLAQTFSIQAGAQPVANFSPAAAVDGQAGKPAPMPAIATPVTEPAWGDQLGDRVVVMANNKLGNAEIRLSPAEMGPLRIQVSVDDGTTHITFNAQHAATRDAIEQALPRLRELLAENGLSLGQADVGDQGVRHGDRDPAEQSVAGSAANIDEGSVDADAGAVAADDVPRRPRGIVDTFA